MSKIIQVKVKHSSFWKHAWKLRSDFNFEILQDLVVGLEQETGNEYRLIDTITNEITEIKG